MDVDWIIKSPLHAHLYKILKIKVLTPYSFTHMSCPKYFV